MLSTFDLLSLSRENLLALRAIEAYTRCHGSGPTLRQLAQELRLRAHSAARHHVLRLGELELITYELTGRKGQIAARTMKLTEDGKRELARILGDV